MLPEPHTPTAADAFGHDSVRSPTVNRLQVSRRRGSEDTDNLYFKESSSLSVAKEGPGQLRVLLVSLAVESTYMVLPLNVFQDARHGDVESVGRWFAEGDRDVNDTTNSGLTLLHAAVVGTKTHDKSPGQCEMIRFLLAKGADVNKVTEDEFGRTPLYHAAFKAHCNASLLLLNAGAHVNVRLGSAPR